MSLGVEPPSRSRFGRFDGEHQPLLVDRPPAYVERFPGDPGNDAPPAPPSAAGPADIQAIAATTDTVQELQIEDTSRRSRRVKGAINRINYWAENSNSCWRANGRFVGKHLMTVCCCGGGQGSPCADFWMLALYLWFCVICPGIGVIGLVQLGFLIINHGVALEWAILFNNLMALANLCYIADIMRRNYNRFLTNAFCIPIASGLLPGSINAFMTLTISNINRVQLLGIQQRNILASQLQERQDAVIHVMLYSDHYVSYVYGRPKKQLITAIVLLVLMTTGQIVGMWWEWDKFCPDFLAKMLA
eukprot:scpid83464/ scgid18265/ 